MVAAALVVLVAGMGVGFGWQPMPDGSPRYEYVVQVEPEMLETLAEGQAIPIVSDVPPGIGPIARVRVVVGRGEPPRRRLITQMKPATDGSAASGVVLTQYTEGASSRYSVPPAATPQYGAPPSGAGATAAAPYDPYTQAAPGTTGAWNGGALPSSNPLRATAGSAPAPPPDGNWNGGQPVAEVADSSTAVPFRRIGAGLQEAVAPVQEGINGLGNQARTAVDNLGNRTGQLLDELGQPLRSGGLLGPRSQNPAPVAAAAATTGATPDYAATPAPVWNGGDGASVAGGSTPTTVAGAPSGSAWNDETASGGTWNPDAGNPTPAPNPGGYRGAGGPEAPPLVTNDSRGTSVPPYSSLPPYNTSGTTGASRTTVVASNSDPWGDSPTTPLPTGGALGGGTTTWPGTGSGATAATGTASGGRLSGGPDNVTGPVLGPAIDSSMLRLPGERSLEGVTSGTVAGGGNIFSPATTGGPVFPGSPSSTGPPSGASGGLLASQGWATGSGAAVTPTSTQTPTTPASDARNKAAVVFAWVLLSGSAAGNIYLFWSYLDVRTKYRALVRKTARAVGSRFSPA